MKLNKITTIVFCALILVFTVASMVNPVRERSETENRDLAQMPKFSLESLFEGSFTTGYESFITDQFVARDAWISMHTAAEKLLGKRDVSSVYLAKDGYYIEKVETDAERIEQNLGYLERMVENLKNKVNLAVVLAPTASLIHEDKLPANAPVWPQEEMLDRVNKLDGAVDLRPALLERKDEYIFFRTDHHWTTRGAYYAYVEIAKSLGIEPIPFTELTETILAEDFLGTTIAKVGISASHDILTKLESKTQPTISVNFNNGQRYSDTIYTPEKLSTRDKYGYFFGGNEPIVDITTSVKNGKTLLIVKDSFAHSLTPLLLNHYERVILLDLRHLSVGVSAYVDELAAKGETVDDLLLLYSSSGFANERSLIWLSK